MRTLLLVLMFLVAGPAGAALIGVAPAGERRIEFYDERSGCPETFSRAVMVEPNGNAAEGCWIELEDGVVFVALYDGRSATGHRRMIKPPTQS